MPKISKSGSAQSKNKSTANHTIKQGKQEASPKIKDIEQEKTVADKQGDKTNNNMEKLRNFLTVNKIFFDTLTTFALASMAVIVAFAQWTVMNQQAQYQEQQTTMQHTQALPKFVIETDQLWNEDKTFRETEKLMVYNYGNSAYNVHVNNVVFLDATLTHQGETQKRRIAIADYYTFTDITNNPTGLVSSSSVTGNNSAFYNLEQHLLEPMNTMDAKGLMSINLARYVSITYTDVFNETHTEYYRVNDVIPADSIDKSEGVGAFEEYYDPKEAPRSVFDLTIEDIYNLFE
jgi:hypothetical protein